MEDRDYLIILYDYYSLLFNDKQKEYFESYYFDNLSLGEISDNLSISRNAVHKGIKLITSKLLFYEDKLKLYKKSVMINNVLEEIDDNNIKDKIRNVLESD